MGLVPGFVCDLEHVPRAAQLRALGNGVVPQQASYAITLLLADLSELDEGTQEAAACYDLLLGDASDRHDRQVASQASSHQAAEQGGSPSPCSALTENGSPSQEQALPLAMSWQRTTPSAHRLGHPPHPARSTVTETTAVDADEARRLRDAMTDKLVKEGWITSAAIEAAFRAVPRHAFAVPGTPLEECYHGHVVRNKKDADGVTLSSISAAWLQARMIEQACIAPGSRVMEIGTTGYNAAVIAEVTGPGGHVITIDIDPEVTGWATAALRGTGYGGRVTAVTGDGEHGAPGNETFDAIIATAGAWEDRYQRPTGA
jgi:protein-L-isoaspartate O-methyltransferase